MQGRAWQSLPVQAIEALSFVPFTAILVRMTGCLTIDDVARLSREPIEGLRRTAAELDPGDADSSRIFAKEVARVETALKQTYKAAALMARRTDTLEEEAEVWRRMQEFAGAVVDVLKQLTEVFPNCGTPELYNLALDYRLAADKRLANISESLQCQNLPTPEGLFPRMT